MVHISSASTATLPSTLACGLVLPDAARGAQDLDVHLQLVAGADRALEARVVDADEVHHRVLVRLHAHGHEGQDGRGLGQRLDHQHARHHRLVREVAVEEFFVDGHVLDRGDGLAQFEVEITRSTSSSG
jgi:hypothetical protein